MGFVKKARLAERLAARAAHSFTESEKASMFRKYAGGCLWRHKCGTCISGPGSREGTRLGDSAARPMQRPRSGEHAEGLELVRESLSFTEGGPRLEMGPAYSKGLPTDHPLHVGVSEQGGYPTRALALLKKGQQLK